MAANLGKTFALWAAGVHVVGQLAMMGFYLYKKSAFDDAYTIKYPDNDARRLAGRGARGSGRAERVVKLHDEEVDPLRRELPHDPVARVELTEPTLPPRLHLQGARGL